MRHSVNFLIALVLSAIIFGLSSCFQTTVETKLTEQQDAADYLSIHGPWGGSGNVVVDESPNGVDPDQLKDLLATFSNSGKPEYNPEDFNSDGADDFLQTDNSTWDWVTTDTDIIAITNASVSQLTGFIIDKNKKSITFSFEKQESNSGGRITGLTGRYTVTLSGN